MRKLAVLPIGVLFSTAVAATPIVDHKHPASVKIGEHEFSCPAKVDTGAFRSSIHAENIEMDLETRTVSFEIAGKSFTETLFDISPIKLRGAEGQGVQSCPEIRDDGVEHEYPDNYEKHGNYECRPVILMELTLEGFDTITAEVNLKDRTGYARPLIVGGQAISELNVAVTVENHQARKKEREACEVIQLPTQK